MRRPHTLRTASLIAPTSLISAIAGLLLLLAPSAALAATRTISYHGVRVTVPSGWPVFHVDASSKICVRFDRHAVYLGTPGAEQLCPSESAGRTEAILISPDGPGATAIAGRGALTPMSNSRATDDDSMLRLVKRSDHVLITATWNHRPQIIRRALGLRSLRIASAATNGHAPKKAVIVRRSARSTAHAAGTATTPVTPVAPVTPVTTATPGQVYSGLGFDACSAPSPSTLTAWAASPYRALGVYIGGANMACTQANLTSSWVSAESAAGWHMVPTYVGLQAPTTGCVSCAKISATAASTEGTAAATDAVTQAQALGIGTGNPIYYDMENYSRTTASTAAVLSFLEAWTVELHANSYLSGVYGSASSGISDLVATAGTGGYTEPDDIWIAHWDDDATTADSYVPSTEWSVGQRLRQYEGANNETYGGVTINLDNDDLDGATAAYGSAATTLTAVATAPTVSVLPKANGNAVVTPSWTGETGIGAYRILGGSTPTAMVAVASVPVSVTTPALVKDSYAYYEVQGLNSVGQVLGTSQPVATPASVAIFGNTIFAGGTGTIGLPIRCVNVSPCEVQGAIFDGNRRLTHILGQRVPGTGSVIKFPMTTGIQRLLANTTEQQVTVVLVTSTGRKVVRKLELHRFRTHGASPLRASTPSPTLRIQSQTEFVSNGWVGGVLATCTANTQCMLTTRVLTRGGDLVSGVRTQTLGAGETGYLSFRLTNHGHALLRADLDNQMPARVRVSSAPAPITNAAGAVQSTTKTTRAHATVSLVAYR